MTASASAISRLPSLPPARTLLASVRAFSQTLARLHERHGDDPEVAAVCRKWARRAAEIEHRAKAEHRSSRPEHAAS